MICYENRNGMLWAYDTDARAMILDKADWTVDPGEIHEILTARGVTSVWVKRHNAYWVTDPQFAYSGDVGRKRQFRFAASQAKDNTGAWVEVPIGRIIDGSDWGDIYG